MRNFVTRLIIYEARGDKSSEAKTKAAFHSCEKLRLHMATFMGNTGSHWLLSRSLALATAEAPCLKSVRVQRDGSLKVLEELQSQLDPEELFEGVVIVLTQLLRLLSAVIGEYLTFRQVREVWPKVSLTDMDFDTGGKYEKTK